MNMKKIVTTVIFACIIGCGGEADAKTLSTTEEIKSVPNVLIVPNTKTISYHLYRQEWRKANHKPAQPWAPEVVGTMNTSRDPEDTHEIVEIELSDLNFKEAFRLEFLGKGEGHIFWWRGNEYTTNLLDVIRRPRSDRSEPFIEKVTYPTTED